MPPIAPGIHLLPLLQRRASTGWPPWLPPPTSRRLSLHGSPSAARRQAPPQGSATDVVEYISEELAPDLIYNALFVYMEEDHGSASGPASSTTAPERRCPQLALCAFPSRSGGGEGSPSSSSGEGRRRGGGHGRQ